MNFTKPLSKSLLAVEVLKEDKKHCKRFGPCGVGKEAVYLNSFYLDRIFYIPTSSVTRVFKRVAMSKGGFTGKGIFATLPYLVVVYDGNKEQQCLFKREEQVDDMIEYLRVHFPQIILKSEAFEIQEKKRKAEESKKIYPELSEMAKAQIAKMKDAKAYLEERPSLSLALTRCAKAKRVNDRANPMYRYVALIIVLMAAAAAVYGVYALITKAGLGLYFLLFGLAAIFLFSGANVLPTRRNNAAFIQKQWDDACIAMENYLSEYGKEFPVPARYAHAVTIERMMQVIKEGRAETGEEALELVKHDLKALNASVTVEQYEFDQIMAIKPMFLVENYR